MPPNNSDLPGHLSCITVKLGDKEQIGVKEPFPVTNLKFTSKE